MDSEKSLKHTYRKMKPPTTLMALTNLRTAASVLAVATAIGLILLNKRCIKTEEDIHAYQCVQKPFFSTILSTNPLLIHIDEFVTSFEAEHLISLA